MAYNQKHGIIPQTIKKPIREKVVEITDTRHIQIGYSKRDHRAGGGDDGSSETHLEFERAIQLQDTVRRLERS